MKNVERFLESEIKRIDKRIDTLLEAETADVDWDGYRFLLGKIEMAKGILMLIKQEEYDG